METQSVINANTLIGMQIFAGSSVDERRRVASRLRGKRFPGNSLILSHKNHERDVYFLISGRARATLYSASGKEVLFQDLDAGQMFGELAAIDNGERSTNVVALSDCFVGVMKHSDFMSVCNEFPNISTLVMHRLSNLARMLLGRIFEFSTLTVCDRVHSELLRLAKNGVKLDNTVTIDSPPTHAEIASRVSTHREAVTKELKRLESEGVIIWQRTKHKILNLSRLQELVERSLSY